MSFEAPFADHDGANGAPTRKPTALDPLCGLVHLERVALLGRDRILAKAKERVPYVWQDIAVAGTIIALAGGPGEGKTTLLFLLLVARLNEDRDRSVEVLGRPVYRAPDGRWVVLIEGEHGEASASRKLERSCDLLGINNIALQRVVIVARKAVHLGSPEWQDITSMVAAGIVSDIAIDTVARVAPADGNDEAQQVALFDLVAKTIDAAPSDDTKPTVWAILHTRKNASGELADVSGSAQRTGQADSVLLVKGDRNEEKRIVSSTVTFAKLREDPDDYPTPATFAIVTGPDGKKHLETGAPESAPTDDRPLETQIEDLLGREGVLTKRAIGKALGRNEADVQKAVDALFACDPPRLQGARFKGKNGREYAALQLRKPRWSAAGSDA